MKKPKLIMLEGPDKVGKTTIYQALRRNTNYGPLVIDRFLASNWVYDSFYHRQNPHIVNYLKIEKKMKKTFDCYLILLICKKSSMQKRIEMSNEQLLQTHTSIDDVVGLFDRYFGGSTFNKIKINTDESLVSCVYQIKEFIGEK
ncbi:MAG TPA: hypothetical protein VJ438_01625 [Candidatus Nanoarchaeia archaeon]|nr:hypothetical protein [Candidatus Nanoarchaeia archaeon]